MNGLWVAERLIRIRFPLPVHDAARAYFLDLNGAVGEGLPDGESVRGPLEDNRPAFLDAARAVMGWRDSPDGASCRPAASHRSKPGSGAVVYAGASCLVAHAFSAALSSNRPTEVSMGFDVYWWKSQSA